MSNMNINLSDPIQLLILTVIINILTIVLGILVVTIMSASFIGVVGGVLLLFGAIALTSSIVYESSTLAFIGLGLTFWGVLLLFVKPVKYVKSKLLDSSAISSLAAIDRIITDLNHEEKGIYLPARYLKGLKGGIVFIPSEKTVTIPPIEEVAKERVFLENPKGICLTPPGLALANLYEKELGKDFVKTDLNYLQNNLPKLFIEDLEIAEALEINTDDHVVHVKITGSIYQDICEEVRKLKNICGSIGCPLCSSLACALARSTGKPVVIEKSELSTNGKVIETYYKILEE
ncbi:MAG: hypothetical protein ACTSUS_04170 [Candidatus Freyarchaeota archaeon]